MSVRAAQVRGPSFIPCHGASAVAGLCVHVVPEDREARIRVNAEVPSQTWPALRLASALGQPSR
jgi:hypothetical protein